MMDCLLLPIHHFFPFSTSAIMKQYLAIFIFSFLLFASYACNRKSNGKAEETKLHDNCLLKHDAGPCRMAIKRYYYDSKEKKCKEFIYGGCKGVVPFETLEECQKGCQCD